MKAIVLSSFGSADNFTAADLPLPDVRKGDVRIKVKAVSFNPVDYQIRKGQSESSHLRSMILGRDLSGTVDTVHADVTDFSIGDEVFSYVCDLASSGTYAEYVSVPAELVARKPASFTHAQAAAVPVAGVTASLALNKARVGPTTPCSLRAVRAVLEPLRSCWPASVACGTWSPRRGVRKAAPI
jgi:NADPH:quinone reductase